MERGIRFLQSGNDFPLVVNLGPNVPSWGLNRWGVPGLRFLPPDDEGFTLRGDRQQLLYKGRRRSHRFTILGDTAFEYDCILEREPESNVITLLMEGAERFDFYRQPDFVKDPFLKGSYAVYKKETLIGEGTGKLCHIHRPEIIESRGRKCWGDVSVIGNELRITIPENFLSEAKYPVVVDPTIGTNTIGSQTTGPDPDNDEYDRPMLDGQMSLNRYTAAQSGGGACTAYVYCYYDDTDSVVLPCLYTDTNNKPHLRKSRNEAEINVVVSDYTYNGVRYYKPEGWRTGTFDMEGNIIADQPVWFGLGPCWFTTRFDYGGVCYKFWPGEYDDDLPPVIEISSWDTYCTIKWSWYFNYTASQNYTRTLTQGVTLTDSRKQTGAYNRTAIQTVKGTTALSRFAVFPRQCLDTVYNAAALKALSTLVRSVIEHVRAVTGMYEGRGLSRNCTETIRAGSDAKRTQGFYRRTQESIGGTDTAFSPVLFLRSLPETARLTDSKTQWAAYIRGLRVEAASMAETRHGGEYYRKQTETVQAAGIPYRSLLIFVRLVTMSFVRDFLLRRFLKSNEELLLKSPVCREIVFYSSIH
jgi:hypothetical protein